MKLLRNTTSKQMVFPSSPRSAARLNPDARDVNEIVDEAATRFNEMDENLKLLIQDLKDQHAAMVHLNDSRLKTAKHLESFAAGSPFARMMSSARPRIQAVVGTEGDDGCSANSDDSCSEDDSLYYDENAPIDEAVFDMAKGKAAALKDDRDYEGVAEGDEANNVVLVEDENEKPEAKVEDTTEMDVAKGAAKHITVTDTSDDEEMDRKPAAKPAVQDDATGEEKEEIKENVVDKFAAEPIKRVWKMKKEEITSKTDEVMEEKEDDTFSAEPTGAGESIRKPEKKVSFKANTADVKDDETFVGVHESVHNLSRKYHEQYSEYLIKYVEDWERTVSSRVNGLLIKYRELQQNAEHYSKKVGSLLQRVEKSKSVRRGLSQKLDRNEIKEMGAFEARDTVGESLYLLMDEVTERAWRDVFPLLLRACRFEADFASAQASLLFQLNKVATDLQSIGFDNDCEMMGRLNNLKNMHTEELYTMENPFVKLTPTKPVAKKPLGESYDTEETEEVQDSKPESAPKREDHVEV